MKLELLSYRRNMKSLIVKILQYGRPKNENCLEHFNLDPKILLQFNIFFIIFFWYSIGQVYSAKWTKNKSLVANLN